jgi:phage shock protein A
MSIFQRISTLFKSNINDLIARAEDPEKMLNQIIVDMRDQLAKAKREVAAAIADERKLRSQLDEELKLTRDWEHRAMLAVRENRDDLARQALLRQQEHAGRAQALEQTWNAQAAETEKLKGSLRQLNERIEEARRKRNLLIAKQKRAQAQKRIHETMSGMSDTSAFEAFNRMAEKIEESERQAVAASEVTQALQGDSLDQEFKALEGGSTVEVDDRLLALKQQMGLLPGGGSTAPKKLGAGSGSEEAADEGGDEIPEVEHEVTAEATSGGEGNGAAVREADLLREFEELEGRDSRA